MADGQIILNFHAGSLHDGKAIAETEEGAKILLETLMDRIGPDLKKDLEKIWTDVSGEQA